MSLIRFVQVLFMTGCIVFIYIPNLSSHIAHEKRNEAKVCLIFEVIEVIWVLGK